MSYPKIDILIEELNKACEAYYMKSNPIMSNYEFDNKYEMLKQLEKETDYIRSDSPTQNVGWHKVIKELDEVELSHPMLSLDKCHTPDELIKFSRKYDCFLSVKCDGLSTTLLYEDGKLISAVTRGNGIVGNDVTHNAMVIRNIPKTIPYKERLIIDGETIISYDDFNKINNSLPKGVEKYKHPRNLASASLTLQDNAIAKERNMKFVAWRVIEGFENIDSNFFKLKEAQKIGFEIVPMFTYAESDKDNLSDMLEKIKEMAMLKGIPCDGAVMTIDSEKIGKSMGRTEKFFLNAIAYKYEDELYETVLEDIIWQPSKTGQLNPVAIFKEIDLDGALTTRATLHNIEYIEGLQLGIGDRILVRRANAVIPRVEDNLDRSGTYTIPEVCPCCGAKAEIRKDGKSRILYCTNDNCTSKLVGLLTHAVSRNALNIDGLSEQTIQFLVDKGWVKSFKDIYHLSKYKDRWSTISGFGKRSVDKILAAIEKSRNTDLTRFLYSLSIPQVGNSASKEINKICNGDYEYFINHLSEVRNKLVNTPGYGNAIAYAMKNYFNVNEQMVREFAEEFNFESKSSTSELIESKIKGKTFVCTGSVNHFKSRKELEKYITDRGGKLSGSVSKSTFVLLNNDTTSNSSKNKKAKELGVPIWSEEEFLEYCEG